MLCHRRQVALLIFRSYINKHTDYEIALAVDIITSNSLNVEIISELIVINENGRSGPRCGGAAPAGRPAHGARGP